MSRITLFFLSISLSLIADFLDIEKLPYLRMNQYLKGPYDKIMVFSVPRTGSSLTYNVFRFLFEEERALSFSHADFRLDRSVLKTHKIPEIEILNQGSEEVLYVITIRHPLQSCISTYRIRPLPVQNMREFCKKLIERQVKYIHFIDSLKQAGYPVAILHYEEFETKGSHYLLDFIEDFFHISVSESDKKLINMGYSRENIYANISTLSDFMQFLPISGFHGKHVALKEFTPPKELLRWLNYYLDPVKSLFKPYGYFN